MSDVLTMIIGRGMGHIGLNTTRDINKRIALNLYLNILIKIIDRIN